MERKQQMIEALRVFAEQRGGMEPGNYGSWRDYRKESASVTRDLHDARLLLRAIAQFAAVRRTAVERRDADYNRAALLAEVGRIPEARRAAAAYLAADPASEWAERLRVRVTGL